MKFCEALGPQSVNNQKIQLEKQFNIVAILNPRTSSLLMKKIFLIVEFANIIFREYLLLFFPNHRTGLTYGDLNLQGKFPWLMTLERLSVLY